MAFRAGGVRHRAAAIARKIASSKAFALAMAPALRVIAADAKYFRGLSGPALRRGFLPVPVHFYYPIPDIDDLARRDVWSRCSPLHGINFGPDDQLDRMGALGERWGHECAWPENPTDNEAEFYVNNGGFSFGCAALLHSTIRERRPRTVIEIGSGNSSRVIGRALSMNGAGSHVIVDPFPSEATTRVHADATILRQKVEELDPGLFADLAAGDILFIDSSHTVRIGGDVNFLFLEVLPILAPGVSVHVHDILLPYEYPRVYAMSTSRYFWTEQYLLQAFLIGNSDWQVELAAYWIQRDHPAAFAAAFPTYDPQRHSLMSSSLWMTRVADRGGHAR